MGATTKIEWCDHTFSPWKGCQKVSPGCDHCYAEGIAKRWGQLDTWGPGATRQPQSDHYWQQPLTWNAKALREGVRPRVFCASMCDVFDNQAPQEWRERLWDLIANTPNLDWLLLTKRPENILKVLASRMECWRMGQRLAWHLGGGPRAIRSPMAFAGSSPGQGSVCVLRACLGAVRH